jgi:hypothetical protein
MFGNTMRHDESCIFVQCNAFDGCTRVAYRTKQMHMYDMQVIVHRSCYHRGLFVIMLSCVWNMRCTYYSNNITITVMGFPKKVVVE